MLERLFENAYKVAYSVHKPSRRPIEKFNDYTESPERPLWTGNFLFPTNQQDDVEQAIVQCAIDDLEGKFRLSGYLIDLGNGISRYTFTNNSRPTNPQPAIEDCWKAFAKLDNRFEDNGISTSRVYVTAPEYLPELDHPTLEVENAEIRAGYGLQEGYNGRKARGIWRLRWKLGSESKVFKGKVISVGGMGGDGAPATYDNTKLYTEPIGLVLTKVHQLKRVYRQAFRRDKQQLLIIEKPLTGTVFTAQSTVRRL